MKSEKARHRLYESFTLNSNIGIDRKAAFEAVELAEQEAEERMRGKAVEAFKSECVYRDQRCKPDCEGCGIVKQFIQKLNEE